MMTDVSPTRMPIEMTLPAQSAPTSTNADVSDGSSTFASSA